MSLNSSKTQSMIMGSRNKLKNLVDKPPLLVDGNIVKFVKQYNYLGIILDEEMTFQPMLKQVKKTITNRLFNLRKIRKYITDKAAVSIYRQTIVPIIDYSGFVNITCCKSDQYDLQKIQNDILRVCYRSHLNDRIKISDLHMLSLEQRMHKQLLWLMYIMSRDEKDRKVGVRDLRSNTKFIFKTDSKIGTKYQRSPYYQVLYCGMNCPHLYNLLKNVYEFKKLVKRGYKKYENLLES